jgi:predicted lipid carrier protein YhbT
MPDPTAEFFDRIGHCQHEDELVNLPGTVRFDITGDQGTEHWLIKVANGDIDLSHEVREADLVISSDRAWFNRIVTGKAQVFATLLRNDLKVAGDMRLIGVLVRLSLPPSGHHPRSLVAKGGDRGR